MHAGNSASKRERKIDRLYANYFKVGYNAFEFVIDFGQQYSDNDDIEFSVRIITSPVFAKDLADVLKDSISQYEKTHGSTCRKEVDG